MSRFLQAALCAFALLCADAHAVPLRSGGSPMPAAARATGYTVNTFSTAAFSTANVDMGLTYASGYKWYFSNYFGGTPAVAGTVVNSDGSISILGGNGNLVSAGEISSAPYYVGTAFGGGAYIETRFSFDPTIKLAGTAWPSIWAMSVEHLVGLSSQQWSGQTSGYDHFMEVDTFEYDRTLGNQYGSTLHDWYGVFNVTCPGSYCNIASDFNLSTSTVPKATDWTIPHRVGVLWIPATVSTAGSYTFYFDDIVVSGPFSYSQFTTQTPPPTSPWTFGIGDQQHLGLLMGSGWSPLKVLSVNVWQTNASSNLHN